MARGDFRRRRWRLSIAAVIVVARNVAPLRLICCPPSGAEWPKPPGRTGVPYEGDCAAATCASGDAEWRSETGASSSSSSVSIHCDSSSHGRQTAGIPAPITGNKGMTGSESWKISSAPESIVSSAMAAAAAGFAGGVLLSMGTYGTPMRLAFSSLSFSRRASCLGFDRYDWGGGPLKCDERKHGVLGLKRL